MKRLGIAAIIVFAVGIATLATFSVVGLRPKDRRAGLWLPGALVTTPVNDWSFTDAFPEIYLQTRTTYLIPHSVTIQCAQIAGQLYIASFDSGGPRRRWNLNVLRDSRVRLQIGERLYDRNAIPLADPTETDKVFRAYGAKYSNWQLISKQPLDQRPTIHYWRIR